MDVMEEMDKFYEEAQEPYAKDARERGTYNTEDRYNKTFLEQKSENIKKSEGLIEFTVEDIEEGIDQVKKNKTEFLEILKTGNITVITNHATWVNIIILAYIFHKALEIPYNDLFIILGPAITIDTEYLEITQSMANLMKTLPEKMADDYPELAAAMFKLFYKTLREEVLDKVGKIIFIAPSGRTDIFTKEGKILMVNPKKLGTTVKMIQKISPEKKGCVVYAGVNDLEIFSNKQPKRGKVYMKISSPTNAPQTEEELRMNLKSRIIDKQGNFIGEFANLLSNGELEIITD